MYKAEACAVAKQGRLQTSVSSPVTDIIAMLRGIKIQQKSGAADLTVEVCELSEG